MNKWSNRQDIRQQLEKHWNQGKFLIPNDPDCKDLFPFRIKLKHPTSAELEKDFSSCQKWALQFKETAPYHIQWKEINHRRLGKNQLPVAIVIDSMQAMVVFLARQDEHRLYHQLCNQLMSLSWMMGVWANRYPFKVLAHKDVWLSLIAVTQWMIGHPRPGIYLRQITIPEVDTKLIEQHKKLLTEWWDILLDEKDVDSNAKGIRSFEQRYGFKSKPQLIRFRILDQRLKIAGLSDLTVTVEEFSTLQLDINTVFVTENDINGLVFPDVDKSIVLFGRGYGFDYLQQVKWLADKAIYYWGDIDTHGISILNQFRHYLPQTKSFLMDEKTLMSHKKQWVFEKKQATADLSCLNRQEENLYNKLRDNEMGKNIRLEQEFVQYLSIKEALESK